MLGSIPRLTFWFCDQLTDISSLRNNRQVEVVDCDQIPDISQSIENTEEISKAAITCKISLSFWKKAKRLNLQSRGSKVLVAASNQIPKTVKRCYLEGTVVSAIDFTATADHVLTLENDTSIKSLESYGLENVAIIECGNMRGLQTLQGLGRGRNRKIFIRGCHKTIDFSPLNHIPIVEIVDCKGFIDPMQVRMVRNLTIAPSSVGTRTIFSFKQQIPLSFAHLSSLTLGYYYSKIATTVGFHGLEDIPALQLNHYWIDAMKTFLASGKQFHNQRIVMDLGSNRFYLKYELQEISMRLQYLHYTYMEDHYDYYPYSDLEP